MRNALAYLIGVVFWLPSKTHAANCWCLLSVREHERHFRSPFYLKPVLAWPLEACSEGWLSAFQSELQLLWWQYFFFSNATFAHRWRGWDFLFVYIQESLDRVNFYHVWFHRCYPRNALKVIKTLGIAGFEPGPLAIKASALAITPYPISQKKIIY